MRSDKTDKEHSVPSQYSIFSEYSGPVPPIIIKLGILITGLASSSLTICIQISQKPLIAFQSSHLYHLPTAVEYRKKGLYSPGSHPAAANFTVIPDFFVRLTLKEPLTATIPNKILTEFLIYTLFKDLFQVVDEKTHQKKSCTVYFLSYIFPGIFQHILSVILWKL
jgi:hypothetical protein